MEELRALHGRALTPYPRNAPATDLANGAVWARPLRRIDARDDGTGTTNTRCPKHDDDIGVLFSSDTMMRPKGPSSSVSSWSFQSRMARRAAPW